MSLLTLTAYVVFSSLSSLTEGNSSPSPRMIFTDKESTMKRFPLPGHDAPVRLLVDGDTVTVVGHKHLTSFDFQNPQKSPVETKVIWSQVDADSPSGNNYNISVVHTTDKDNRVFVCGTDGRETLCCSMIKSKHSAQCSPSGNLEKINRRIREFIIKEGEPSALETTDDAALYITYSGSQEQVGIHKFGQKPVKPATNNKEQHYVGLVLSKRKNDLLQSKVYAFYKEKNEDRNLYSQMWLPFVTQVCMADTGGPKNNMQFSWTSQMNARLFCGDPDSRQQFSELVEVATLHANQWEDTRVYALFTNEWGMSAVCVYRIKDIDNVFTKSRIKGSSPSNPMNRPRECVVDSTKITVEILNVIKQTSEVEDYVRPVENSGPILINHHSYTHIYVDGSPQKRNDPYPVLFLSLKNGRVHKVTQNKSHTFIIAEYRPFNHRAHILAITLQASSRKLYVSSASEVVQVDVGNCDQYGDTCLECRLARDPYCSWNQTECSPVTQGRTEDGDVDCSLLPSSPHKEKAVGSIRIPSRSKYFLQCPVMSHHAEYTWRHDDKPPIKCSWRDQQCLLLIDSMGPEQEGTYRCVSEEMGSSRELAKHHLKLGNGAAGSAARSAGPLMRVCLVTALIQSVSCWS